MGQEPRTKQAPAGAKPFRCKSFRVSPLCGYLVGHNPYPRLAPWATDLLPLRGLVDALEDFRLDQRFFKSVIVPTVRSETQSCAPAPSNKPSKDTCFGGLICKHCPLA